MENKLNPYEPILQELAIGMLEKAGIKPNYSDAALLSATLIFQSVFIDKLYDYMEQDGMSQEDREKMAQSAGTEIRKLIHTYTGLDTHQLAK